MQTGSTEAEYSYFDADKKMIKTTTIATAANDTTTRTTASINESAPMPISELQLTAYDLFSAFSLIALSGFGGVVPFAYRGLVEKRGWLTAAEFAEFLGLSQMLPGPTICNVALMVGHKYRGTRGALAALAGLIVFPFLLVIALGVLYQRYGELPFVRNALNGMAAVAAGLILSTAIKMGTTMFRKPELFANRAAQTVLMLLAFTGLGLMGWRLIWVFGALVPAGTLLFYVMRNKKEARHES